MVLLFLNMYLYICNAETLKILTKLYKNKINLTNILKIKLEKWINIDKVNKINKRLYISLIKAVL